MANTHKFVVKNGLQTQNISFVDSDQNNTIFARMLSNDALAFSGNAGQLFSISDSLSGTIFAVNDISGVPSIEVDDDGEIRFAETFGHVLIGTDSSLNTGTYILQVNGGIHADSVTVNNITASNNVTAGYLISSNIYNTSGTMQIDGTAGVQIDATGGGVTLRHQTYTKLVTTPTGIDITGEVVADSATLSGDLTVGGNLTVSGTTTTINTETINLADNIIVLNSNETGTPSQNSGIEVERGTSTNAILQWDEGNDYWEIASGGTTGRILTTGDEGTGNGLDADTVDGIQASSFLRSDADDSASGRITLDDDLIFSNRTTTDGHIHLYNGTSASGYAIGVEGNTLYSRSYANHRWYIGSLADGGTSDKMELTASQLTVAGDIQALGGNYNTNTSSDRVKFRTYTNDPNYGMGMQSGVSYGGLNNDWAVTFQMNADNDRGFWWGDTGHSTSQGAMALTTQGKLTVAHSARIGYGETDTTIPGASYTLDITGGIVTDTIDLDSATFTGTTISLRTVDSDGTQVSALSFEGDAGQLFSIVDSMGGTIFSVNDISGIPSIEVDDDGEIRLAEFNGHVLVGYASAPQSTSTYPLQVDGGIYANGTINGTFSGNGSSITSINASNISSGTISDARLPATISSDITGNAATVTATANNSTNETVYLTFVDGATGSQGIETDTSLTYNPSTNLLAIASNTDISAEIGRAHIGYVGHGDWAAFSHVDQNTTTSYALMQDGNGRTILNSANGQVINFRTNNTDILIMNSSGLTAQDNKYIAAGDGSDLQIYHNATSSFITNATGGLTIRNNANDADILIQSDDGSGGTADYFRADGSTGDAILYHYGSEKLKTQSTGVSVTGLLSATTKSFIIDHPTKPNHKLRYGSLEGPENGVYVRGRLKGGNVIELPDYWKGLVHEDSITVELTAIGKHQKLYVEDFDNTKVIIGNDNLMSKEINCFYTVYGERKDVDKLEVEYES